METERPQNTGIHKNFISGQKCVLLDTTYVILHLSQQDTSVFAFSLHRNRFVTGLYLDKHNGLWQYIVEVDAFWHNILCLTVVSGCRCLNFKRKSRFYL